MKCEELEAMFGYDLLQMLTEEEKALLPPANFEGVPKEENEKTRLACIEILLKRGE